MTSLNSEIDEKREAAFFIKDDRVGMTVAAVADVLADDYLTPASAASLARNARISGHVTCDRTGESERAHHLYRPASILALAVLARATESGIGSPAVRAAVGRAMERWEPGDEPAPGPLPAPGALVLIAYGQGERGFALDVTWFTKPSTSEPVVAVRMRQETPHGPRGSNFPADVARLPVRSNWTCALDPILAHLTRKMGAVH